MSPKVEFEAKIKTIYRDAQDRKREESRGRQGQRMCVITEICRAAGLGPVVVDSGDNNGNEQSRTSGQGF